MLGVKTSAEVERTDVKTDFTIVETSGKTGGDVIATASVVDWAFNNWLIIVYVV